MTPQIGCTETSVSFTIHAKWCHSPYDSPCWCRIGGRTWTNIAKAQRVPVAQIIVKIISITPVGAILRMTRCQSEMTTPTGQIENWVQTRAPAPCKVSVLCTASCRTNQSFQDWGNSYKLFHHDLVCRWRRSESPGRDGPQIDVPTAAFLNRGVS